MIKIYVNSWSIFGGVTGKSRELNSELMNGFLDSISDGDEIKFQIYHKELSAKNNKGKLSVRPWENYFQDNNRERINPEFIEVLNSREPNINQRKFELQHFIDQVIAMDLDQEVRSYVFTRSSTLDFAIGMSNRRSDNWHLISDISPRNFRCVGYCLEDFFKI